jgi:hypothetical protein
MRKRNFKIMLLWTKRSIVGKRVRGQKVSHPSFRSVYPNNTPEEFQWMQEFRISSMLPK